MTDEAQSPTPAATDSPPAASSSFAMDAAVLPPYPNNKNRRGRIVGVPDGKPYYFTITDEIARPQKDLPTKLLCLQRLKFDDDGREEIRVGYYIIGKKENRRGKWVWGQYCTLMPMSDFQALIGSAEERGWMTHAPTSPD